MQTGENAQRQALILTINDKIIFLIQNILTDTTIHDIVMTIQKHDYIRI